MTAISKLIFNGENHYVTSPFGKRTVIQTSAGNTSSTHNGTDYGTNGKKIAQYAIEDGYIFAAQKASDGAYYVWVIYPRIKKAFLHYHLDSYKVKAGQTVKKGTMLGYTGKTGKATGVHLHLGIRDLARLSDNQVKNITWSLLQSCEYIDPEKLVYAASVVVVKSATPTSADFLPKRGYFKRGDISANVGKIAAFMYKTFPAYTKKSALGNIFGKNLEAATKEFQRRTGLKSDGFIGALTLQKLEQFGFKK